MSHTWRSCPGHDGIGHPYGCCSQCGIPWGSDGPPAIACVLPPTLPPPAGNALTSGAEGAPTTYEEWEKLCASVLDRQPKSYVAAAMVLAARVKATLPVVRDCMAVVDNLTAVQGRCTELLEQMRALKKTIRQLAATSDFEQRERIVGELVTLTKAIQ